IEAMREAGQQQDRLAVKSYAHKLKGSAGSLGLNSLYSVCKIIESSNDQLAVYLDRKTELESSLDQSIQALAEFTEQA
ncbi:Hpt domain-containing protein, partial [Vibrio makurazakiensis]|uniref:Hpt domain-containing protein n=1 Tax=Vibrio makurazakiensis TaxID=2910250 RepID=UPI003D12A76D